MAKVMYIRSTSTGQVYKTDTLPMFGGWEVVTEAEYIAWCKERGL